LFPQKIFFFLLVRCTKANSQVHTLTLSSWDKGFLPIFFMSFACSVADPVIAHSRMQFQILSSNNNISRQIFMYSTMLATKPNLWPIANTYNLSSAFSIYPTVAHLIGEKTLQMHSCTPRPLHTISPKLLVYLQETKYCCARRKDQCVIVGILSARIGNNFVWQ
jgi:hypothetical protein